MIGMLLTRQTSSLCCSAAEDRMRPDQALESSLVHDYAVLCPVVSRCAACHGLEAGPWPCKWMDVPIVFGAGSWLELGIQVPAPVLYRYLDSWTVPLYRYLCRFTMPVLP